MAKFIKNVAFNQDNPSVKGPGMDSGSAVGKVVVVLVLVVISVIVIGWAMGSSNPYTPAGHIGYVTQGAWFGEAKFLGMQNGPTSYGKTWLASVVNVPIMPFTYDEEFDDNSSVMSKDNLKIKFAVHVTIRIRADKGKEFVEKFSRSQEDTDKIVDYAYENYFKEPVRTYARDEIQLFEALKIKDNIMTASEKIKTKVEALAKDTPFEVVMVNVGNIQFPQSVSDANATYMATTIMLTQKATELEIANKQKEIRRVEAEGVAGAMKEITDKLTPAYLQYEAIKAMLASAGNPNHTTVYIPVGPMGVPLVGTFDAGTGTTPAPKK